MTFDDLPNDVLWLILRKVVLSFIAETYSHEKSKIERGDYSDLEYPSESCFLPNGYCGNDLTKLSLTCKKIRRVLKTKTDFHFIFQRFRFKAGAFSNPI